MLNSCGSQENDKFYGVKWEPIVTDNFIRDTVGGNVFFKISDNNFVCLAASRNQLQNNQNNILLCTSNLCHLM